MFVFFDFGVVCGKINLVHSVTEKNTNMKLGCGYLMYM